MRYWLPALIMALIAGAAGWLCATFGKPLFGAPIAIAFGVILGIVLFCWMLQAYDRLMG